MRLLGTPAWESYATRPAVLEICISLLATECVVELSRASYENRNKGFQLISNEANVELSSTSRLVADHILLLEYCLLESFCSADVI